MFFKIKRCLIFVHEMHVKYFIIFKCTLWCASNSYAIGLKNVVAFFKLIDYICLAMGEFNFGQYCNENRIVERTYNRERD